MPYLTSTVGTTAHVPDGCTSKPSEVNEQSDKLQAARRIKDLLAPLCSESLANGISRFRQSRLARIRYDKDLTHFLSSALHEPQKKIGRLRRQNKKYLASVERFRNRQQSQAALKRHLDSFTFAQRIEFQSHCITDQRSRLLVSFHFGDFIYGNSLLVQQEPTDRRQHFLTQLNSTAAFVHNMRTSFGAKRFERCQQLTLASSTPADLVALLRKPGYSLLIFADLPQGFGERIGVRFLGRNAWFPKGPATLALVSKAPILPVLNYWDGKTNRIQLAQQIEPHTRPGETLQGAPVRHECSALLHGDGLLAGDLAYNIHLGENQNDWQAIETVCDLVGLSEIVQALPLGYATEIGEMGSMLSAGQVQRVLLARALFRSPKILLLDESLSHLDTMAAIQILESMKKRGITILLVTHSPELIEYCDHKLAVC